jgi:hypothetical protein
MTRNRTLGTPYELQVVTSDFQTEAHVDRYLVATPSMGPAVTVTLDPSAFNGDQVVIQDASLNTSTYPITIDGVVVGDVNSIADDGGSLTLTYSSQLGAWVAEFALANDSQLATSNEGFNICGDGTLATETAGPHLTTIVGIEGASSICGVLFTPLLTGKVRVTVNATLTNSGGAGAAAYIGVARFPVGTTFPQTNVLPDFYNVIESFPADTTCTTSLVFTYGTGPAPGNTPPGAPFLPALTVGETIYIGVVGGVLPGGSTVVYAGATSGSPPIAGNIQIECQEIP